MDIRPLSPEVGGLTVVYDPDRDFCTWCRAWLEAQPLRVPVRFTPAGGVEASARLGVLGAGVDLAVVADDGRTWTGAAAFVLCLWATVRHRDLSHALRLPADRRGAEAYFAAVTANRVVYDRLVATCGPAEARSA